MYYNLFFKNINLYKNSKLKIKFPYNLVIHCSSDSLKIHFYFKLTCKNKSNFYFTIIINTVVFIKIILNKLLILHVIK